MNSLRSALVAFVCCCLMILLPHTSLAQCRGWLPGYGYKGVENQIYFSVPWDPDGPGPQPELLVLGGHFEAVGADPFRFLAAFDGERFIPLGDNFFGGIGSVYVHNADLYVAGTHLEWGNYQPGVFRWNTTTLEWQRVGDEPSGGSVYTLGSYNGELVAAGNFSGFGATAANRIARFDGTSWQPFGTGLGGVGSMESPIDMVQALAVYQGELYAGGYFSLNGDNTLVNNIARWNGSQWVSVNGGTNTATNIYSMDANSSGLYIGGDFTAVAGQNIRYAARWNGSSWSALGAGPATWVYHIRLRANGDLVVGGLFSQAGGQAAHRIASWSPASQSWSTFGPGFSNDVLSTADYQGFLFACGRFDQTGVPSTAGGRGMAFIARWNGTDWLPAVTNGLSSTRETQCIVYSLATYNNNLVAGGRFWFFGGEPVNGVAIRENGQWHALGNGFNNGTVPPLIHAMAEWDGKLYVGGTFLKPTGAPSNAIGTAYWDGTAWRIMGTGANHNTLAVCSFGPHVYYGGLFSSMSGVANTAGIARWDGSAWSAVGTGIPGGQIWTMIQFGTDLVVAGRFNAAGGVPAKNIARWDGTTWHAMGDGIGQDPNNIIKALAVYNGQLYAGGEYIDFSGATPMRGVVRWNGSAWEQVGFTPNNLDTVLAMGVHAGKLFVGGTLETSINGVPVSNLASFDGTSWNDMRGGVDDYVEAFFSLGDELYVGGPGFDALDGGSVSPSLARWSENAGIYAAYQPVPQAIASGNAVRFSTRAGGVKDGVTFQWRRNGTPVSDGPSGASAGGGLVAGANTATLTILAAACSDAGAYDCVLSSPECSTTSTNGAALTVAGCTPFCTADFNGDGDFGTDFDIEAFFACLAGNCCQSCLTSDFNADGDFGTDADIEAFFRVLAGGPC